MAKVLKQRHDVNHKDASSSKKLRIVETAEIAGSNHTRENLIIYHKIDLVVTVRSLSRRGFE